MFSVDVSYDTKIIHVTASGCMKKEELQELIRKLIEIFDQFQEKEASLMVSAEKLDTFPQESIQAFSIVTELCLKRAKKIAEVHARTITRMQSTRVEHTVKQSMRQKQSENGKQGERLMEGTIENQKDSEQNRKETEIMRFRTKWEALAYLQSDV